MDINDQCAQIYKELKSLLNDPNPLTYPDQPERSKREDLVHLKLHCPECKFEWEQYIDMMDYTDGISPCIECGYNNDTE